MYLYKLEITLEQQTVNLIVAAEDDDKAFSYVEGQLTRHFVSTPQPKEIALVEKKRLSPGSGYVIEGA
ncbi:DUF3906 family protein [Paenibacillus senegalensis]|uniref:DUF3906 family protein n=1 Tax=Paenibacillus senegalensis TaxID=1465766 RepID=UPI00028934E8|nr:DUF3906 family protein [Paenibacillus senegalensis]